MGFSAKATEERELRLGFSWQLGRERPAKHLFGLHRVGQSPNPVKGRNLNRLSSSVIQRHGTVQKHTAVHPRTIHSKRRRLSRRAGVQLWADVPLGRMLQILLSFPGDVGPLKTSRGGWRALARAPAGLVETATDGRTQSMPRIARGPNADSAALQRQGNRSATRRGLTV